MTIIREVGSVAYMNINITPEDVDALVKEAILKAGIGQALTVAMQKTMSGYDNPVESSVKAYVRDLTAQILREKFSDKIKAAVELSIEQTFTEEVLKKMSDEVVERAVNRI